MTALIGFATVFVVICAVASAVCGGLLIALQARIARLGPATERRVATLAAAIPVVLAIVVVAILAIDSWLGPDHCTTHDHHAHLCVRHGGEWAQSPLALVLLVVGSMTLASRAALMVGAALRGRAIVRGLRRIAVEHDGIELVDSDRPFCFVASGAIVASRAAQELLSADEWRAMIAHERAHLRHRDLGHRLVVDLLLLFAAPLVAIAVRERWDDSTERLRDADAAATSSPETVASALVAMARSTVSLNLEAVAAFARPRRLANRVESLLDEVPTGNPRSITASLCAATVIVIVVAGALAEPLHHILETLLG